MKDDIQVNIQTDPDHEMINVSFPVPGGVYVLNMTTDGARVLANMLLKAAGVLESYSRRN